MATRKPTYIAQPQEPIDFDAAMAALSAQAAQVAAPAEPRGMARAVADTGLSFGRGAVQGVRMLTDLAGADNAVSGGLRSVEDYISSLKSAEAQADERTMAQILRDAEGKGLLDQVVAGFRAFGVAPVQTLAQAVGTSIPTVATALIPGAGPAAVAGRMGAALGIGAGQGAGAVKSSIYDEVLQAQLAAGKTPEEAQALAAQAQAYGGPNAGQIALGAGLGAWAGRSGIEAAADRLVRGTTKAAPGIARRVGIGAAAEGVPEALQGGQEKFATNTALANEGFDVDPMAGVVASGTMEALAGAAMGGALGIPRPPMRPGDQLRADKLPEVGPMSRAVNAAVEAAAKKADAGEPLPPEPMQDMAATGAPTAEQPADPGQPAEAAAPAAQPPAIDFERVLANMHALAAEEAQSMRQFGGAPAPAAPMGPVTVIGPEPVQRPSPDILNPKGEPFRNLRAAQKARAAQPDPGAFDVVPVDGGYVVRPTQGFITDGQADADAQPGAPDGAAVPGDRGMAEQRSDPAADAGDAAAAVDGAAAGGDADGVRPGDDPAPADAVKEPAAAPVETTAAAPEGGNVSTPAVMEAPAAPPADADVPTLKKAWSDAVQRGDTVLATQINDRIVAAKGKNAPAPRTEPEAPAEQAPAPAGVAGATAAPAAVSATGSAAVEADGVKVTPEIRAKWPGLKGESDERIAATEAWDKAQNRVRAAYEFRGTVASDIQDAYVEEVGQAWIAKNQTAYLRELTSRLNAEADRVQALENTPGTLESKRADRKAAKSREASAAAADKALSDDIKFNIARVRELERQGRLTPTDAARLLELAQGAADKFDAAMRLEGFVSDKQVAPSGTLPVGRADEPANAAPVRRMGDNMGRLDRAAVEAPLSAEQRADKDVQRFIDVADRVARAEMDRDPATWTPEQRKVYNAGDWQRFSRLSGYSGQEIAEFADFMRLAGVLDERYGEDFSQGLDFGVSNATAPAVQPQSGLPDEGAGASRPMVAPAPDLASARAELRAAMGKVDAVNAEWESLYRDGLPYFTGDGPSRKLSASAPDAIKERFAAFKAAKKGAQRAYDEASAKVKAATPVSAPAPAAPPVEAPAPAPAAKPRQLNGSDAEKARALFTPPTPPETPTARRKRLQAEKGNVTPTAQAAVDAFNADNPTAAVAIMAKLKLADLQEVGAAVGFRPQIGENATKFRERIGGVADRLTKTAREKSARQRALYDKLIDRATDYDRAADHAARAKANGVADDSTAYIGFYREMGTPFNGGSTEMRIPALLDKLAADVASLRDDPDYAEVAAMVQKARPRVFEHKASAKEMAAAVAEREAAPAPAVEQASRATTKLVPADTNAPGQPGGAQGADSGGSVTDQKLAQSKIRDDRGNLLRLYHGTQRTFEKFDVSEDRRGVGGIWFTDSKNYAYDMSRGDWSGRKRGAGGTIIHAFLAASNPKEFDVLAEGRRLAEDAGIPGPEDSQAAQELLSGGIGWDAFVGDVVSDAIKAGHDALVIRNFSDGRTVDSTAYVVFDANNIVVNKVEPNDQPAPASGGATPAAEEAAAPAEAAPATGIAPMPGIPGLSMSLAQSAHRGTSFSPERRGEQEVAGYREALRDAWDRAARVAGKDEAAIARITEVFEDVAAGYNARYAASLGAKSQIVSTMIAGGSNFPVRRMEKRNATARKRAEEASEYLERGIKRLLRAARGPIDHSPESELERVRLNLTQREELQEQMKAANAALRKDDDAALEDLGFTAEQIAELKKPDFAGRTGFPAYRLSNNNAEIARLRERLKSAEERMAAAQAGPVEQEYNGVRMVEDATDDRLRLYFDGKPNDAVREDLKAAAFKWSPKNEAWQRQLTPAAKYAAKQVLDKHFPASQDEAGNVAMLKRGTNATGSLDIESARALAAQMAERGMVRLNVVQSVADMPARQRDKVLALDPAGQVRGAYFRQGDSIWMVADNIRGADEFVRIAFHEAFHRGLARTIPEAKAVLREMWRTNQNLRAATAAQMKAHGIGQDEAIEEALAVMAEAGTVRDLKGWGKLLETIRSWVAGFAKALGLEMTWTDDMVLDFVAALTGRGLQGGVHVNTGQGTAAAPAPDAEPAADGPMLARTADALRDTIPEGVQQWLTDRTVSQRGFNRVWHRTVGTQLHKAKINKDFGRVYYAVQDFMKDVSRIATLAADKAPDMLPQIESLGDLARLAPTLASPAAYKQRKADIQAASAALFDGTLRYTRDEDGKAVKVEPDSAELGGIVWTDAELRERGLSDRAVKMYRQSRQAIDQSLENMLAADLYRQASVLAPEMLATTPGELDALLAGMRRAAASENPGQAYTLMRNAIKDRLAELETALDGQPNQHTPDLMARRQELRKLQTSIADKAQRIADLQDAGYAPLMRFGPYAVDAVNADGRRVFFGLYESQAAANKAARNFRGDGLKVTQSIMPQKDFEALQGVSPETALLFAEMLGVEKNEAMQKWLQNAVAEQSALKRHIRRKGIEGFDEDGGRVLAAFVTSNARAASRALHAARMADAVENVQQGDVKDEARALVEYVNNPKEEAQALRGLLFVQYIGGSIASAMVNLTQTLVQTLPYLSQYGGAIKAGARLSGAMKTALADKIADPALAKAVLEAEIRGTIKPQEVFQLQAEASRSLGSNLYARSLLAAWGSMFQLAEQFNRRTAFIAAYETARQQGMADPFAFAENAVDETQSVFNKGNRPSWSRGAVGSTLFTFKTFTIQYLEFLKRLATAGEPGSPERAQGRKAAALALLTLVMLSGMKGLPFADDADDLIDTVAQGLGYNWTTDAQRDKWLDALLGETFSDLVQHGFSGMPGVPFDVSQRLGMANLWPGTGLFKTSESNKQNQVLEVFGVAGSAVRDATQGQFLPVAIRNLMQGLDIYETGLYRDRRGRNVTEADMVDAVLKGIGLQPSNVARAQREIGRQIQQRSLYQAVKEELTDAMAQARFDGDDAALRNAQQALARWNDTNPEARIIILPQTIRQRLRQMRMSKAERTVANTPRPLRAQTAEALQ